MRFLEPLYTVRGSVGVVWAVCVVILCIKSCCDVHEAGMAIGFRVHKVEPMLSDWP